MKIRPYRKRDAKDLLALIRALARYEKLDPPTDAAAKRLIADIGRRIHVLMAEVDGHCVGYAIYLFTYSSFRARPSLYLEDIFVLPEWRGHGAGVGLFRACAKEAVQRGCGRMDWQVLSWNEPSIKFYERLGARHLDTWLPFRLDSAALGAVAGP